MTKQAQSRTNLPQERRQTILETLAREGRVVAARLSEALEVSEDTIRRDLRALDREGLIKRVHGGALPLSPALGSHAARAGAGSESREAVARAAATLVRDETITYFDSGTTILAIARFLPPGIRGTAITASPLTAAALAGYPGLEVSVIGGRLDPHTMAAGGARAMEEVAGIRADLLFLGVCGVHPQAGISASRMDETFLKRALLSGASEVAAAVSAEKINTVGPYDVAPIHDLNHLVIPEDTPQEILVPYTKAGVEILKA